MLMWAWVRVVKVRQEVRKGSYCWCWVNEVWKLAEKGGINLELVKRGKTENLQLARISFARKAES